MGKGSADPRYSLTLPGVLQLVIVVLSIIVLICVSVGDFTLNQGGGWTLFVAIIAIILVGVLFAMHVTLTQDTCCGHFNIVEFVIHCVLTLFYFIAFILEAVIASNHYYYVTIRRRTYLVRYEARAEIAATVFCALAFIVLCVYVVVSFKSGKFRSSSATATTTTTTATTGSKSDTF